MRELVILCFALLIAACGHTPKSSSKVPADRFTLPEIPILLTSSAEHMDYVVSHYWKHFDFSDTTFISRPEITEQAFVNFIDLLPQVSFATASKVLHDMMRGAEVDSAMFAHFIDMSERYLYDPNSPFRNGEYYILILEEVIKSNRLPELYKVRPRYQLEMALKNRVGQKATDFTYTTSRGRKAELYSTPRKKILLFFFRPDCPSCKETKEYVVRNDIDRRIAIIWVNLDKDTHLDSLYDLRATPTLYLLDKDKTVLLKDAPIEQIETYLKTTSI